MGSIGVGFINGATYGQLAGWLALGARAENGFCGANVILTKKQPTAKNRRPFILLARPARFERAAYGFEDKASELPNLLILH